MYGRERRQSSELDTKALREGLTAAQLNPLETLEHLGWTLRFVRKPMFRDPLPVLFHRDATRYVVREADCTLDETPDLVNREIGGTSSRERVWPYVLISVVAVSLYNKQPTKN